MLLALLVAVALPCVPAAASPAVPNIEHLPPDCVPDTDLGGPRQVEFVVWCSVRPGPMRFEIETSNGVRLDSVPARVPASGGGARGSFRCHRTSKGARCAGYVGGPLTIRGKLGLAAGDRCEPIRIKTHFSISGGRPHGCPGVREPRLKVQWGYFRGFRAELGIDYDLHGDRAAIDRRIRGAIAAWHRGEPVARVSEAEMGLPLTPLETRRFEFREELLTRTVDELERWVPGHAADTYAGYTLDIRGPIVIRVGFTGDQQAQLAEFKRQADLFAPNRVQPFLVPPAYSEKQLGEFETQILESLESPDSPLGRLINSVGSGPAVDKVEIGTQHVAKVKRLLLAMFGTLEPFHITFEPPAELL